MRILRRDLPTAIAAAAILLPPGLPRAQPVADPRLAERSTGRAEAPVTVFEFFSLTCGHCAAFHRDTWPQVRRELVEPGIVRMVWRDFPLDQVGLLAAVVARSLPPERYDAFTGTLLANQDRWAFRPDPIEELARLAALAGLPRAQFDAARADQVTARALINGRLEAEREFQIQSTPSFVFQSGRQSQTQAGNITFEAFARRVQEVRRA
jgi:protein-disulfide isomerase